jgi:rhamnogalacturonyl hydrolase YesR
MNSKEFIRKYTESAEYLMKANKKAKSGNFICILKYNGKIWFDGFTIVRDKVYLYLNGKFFYEAEINLRIIKDIKKIF